MTSVYYQPIVKEYAEFFISLARESNFFIENEIENEDFAMDYMCRKYTEKFILGELSEEMDDPLFTEDEIEKFLSEIVVTNHLYHLKNLGFLDIIEDENNEEGFFLTEIGKKIGEELNKKK